MSCDHRRTAFFAHATITGPGTAAAIAFGDPTAAQQILRDLFDTASNQPPPTDLSQQQLDTARTRLLFLRFQQCGIAIPTHAASGLPSARAQHAYALVQMTLHALETGKELPELAQQLVAAQRTLGAPAVRPATLDEVLQLAATTRSDTGTVLPEARDRLLARLPVVDIAWPLSAATLQAFTADAFGLPTERITLAEPTGAGLHGVSGDAVFLVRDDRRAVIIGAVKAFSNRTTFAAELSAMQRLAALDAHGIAAPQLRAVASARHTAGSVGLLAMQAAPGQGVDKYMQLGARTGAARAAAYTQLQHAIRAAAQLLARLHTQIGGGPARPAPAVIERFCTSLQDITAKLVQQERTARRGTLDTHRLQTRSAALIAAVQQQPGPAALAHNDAHPGNIFYDTQHGATLIDLASMHQSMNAHGAPIGIAARDTAYFAHKLAYFGPGWGLSQVEIGQMQELFQQTYAAAGGAVIPPAADTFFQLRVATGELIELSGRIGPQPSRVATRRLAAQTALVNRILYKKE